MLPLIRRLAGEIEAPLSIDTRSPVVARAAAAAGARLWNDVSALRAPGALDAAAELGLPVILRHMLGEPATMQEDPRYADVVSEVLDFLAGRAEAAMAAGLGRDKILLDPGIG